MRSQARAKTKLGLPQSGEQGDGGDLVFGEVLPLDGRGGALGGGALHGDDALGSDDEVKPDIVRRRGDAAAVDDLQLVDGGGHQRARTDEAGGRGDGELEVAEPTTLAEAGAVLAYGDATGDDQVDRLELGHVDGA